MLKRFIVGSSILIALLGFNHSVSADVVGERHTFFVNPTYDATARTSVPATLEYISDHAYIYVEDSYLNTMSAFDRQTFDQRAVAAGHEFDVNIYTKEIALWGSEANPGIDNDSHITIFLERLSLGTGGYFDSINDYPPDQATHTNQREMIIANVTSLNNDHLKMFLAHEFQHLVSFNQKEILQHVSEEVWLNELRSQYSITAVGYNNDFQNSDLMQRMQTFLQNPSDSLTEWPNTIVDYASVTLFGQYLVDRFGASILSETLHSPLSGIASINEYLTAHHQVERFTDIFTDWVWTNYINTASGDPKFQYTNPNLQTIHVPLTDARRLLTSVPTVATYSLKPWQPNWDQFILDRSAPSTQNIKISWHDPKFQVYYADITGVRMLRDGDVITPPLVGLTFVLMPINISKTEDFGISEAPALLTLTLEYTNQSPSPLVSPLHDGSLIMHAGTPDIYVIWGQYKRYLAPEVLKFYGLDASQAVIVSEAMFQSYMPSNYIRAVNEKKVYAVWPDGTKHWLNMTAQHFTDSHRDWNSVFIVNDLESNFYRIGADIKN